MGEKYKQSDISVMEKKVGDFIESSTLLSCASQLT
jgi:hypothetical protein